jgi:GDP-L-fucose synthase
VKVLVAGISGLAGTAIARAFRQRGYEVLGINRSNLDLRDRIQTNIFLDKHRPQIVIDAAAKVGGIAANNSFPVDFLLDNVRIQANLMEAAYLAEVPRFVFLGSSCIYPRQCEQPIKEEYLMSGELEPTNSAYAVAKIAGVELINSYRKQYGRNWISLFPTNLFGPGDNFNLDSAHVMPALIRKFYEASELGNSEVALWGTGNARREFMYIDDFAEAVLFATENRNSRPQMNIGVGKDLSIRELALKIANSTGYKGEVIWDASKPDGTPRKLLDTSKLSDLGWRSSITLDEGIGFTVGWYRDAIKRGEVRLT